MRAAVLVLGVVASLASGAVARNAEAQHATDRWLDPQAFTLTLRYRFVDAASTGPDANQLQANEILRFRVKADRAGRVAVGLGASTGPSFTGGWNDTGVGTGHQRFHVNLRLTACATSSTSAPALRPMRTPPPASR